VWRLKFFKILLPALLLPFLVFLALTVRERPASHTPSQGTAPFPGARAERIDLTDLSGGERRFTVQARVVQQDGQGRLHLEGIERLLLDREAQPPLVVSAERGGVEGAAGQRLMRLEGGVNVQDDAAGLAVSLPTLEVNETTGEARSIGVVELRDPTYHGRAASVVYGLRGQPTQLTGVDFVGNDGSSLAAQQAVLREGPKDLEFQGEVRGAGKGWKLASEHLDVQRDAEGRLRHATASDDVVGTGPPEPGGAGPARFEAGHVEATWDDLGRPGTLLLEGSALVRRGAASLAARRIEAKRSNAAPPASWNVVAGGSIRATGLWAKAPAVVQSDTLEALVDARGELLRADLEGGVRFEGGGSAGEAAHLTYVPGGKGRITLTAAPGRRARMARDRTRIAADEISTDPEGVELNAQGRVESSLLPSRLAPASGPPAGGLFQEGEAVHFVSARLKSRSAEERLDFDGGVRGWQGERNLSADHVDLKQRPEDLHARGNVTTRIPRARAGSVSEADYIRVAAEQLDYDAEGRKAVYTGGVRVRQAEGWLEAARVEVQLASEGGDIREMVASGSVRFEFHSSAGGSMPQPATGEGDRVEYTPEDNLIRLFGEGAPATVRRAGAQGGTTTGRVLRYRLDLGTIEVESGDRNRARIRTTGK
jgi:lipopolysaccharide transport protein LptA